MASKPQKGSDALVALRKVGNIITSDDVQTQVSVYLGILFKYFTRLFNCFCMMLIGHFFDCFYGGSLISGISSTTKHSLASYLS